MAGMNAADSLLRHLMTLSNPHNVAGMARFGIRPARPLGVPMPVLRKLARQDRGNHRLAAELWASGIHEARILACLIDDPQLVNDDQMERWAADFDSWDVCDQCCMNLFRKTTNARQKALEWAGRKEEFVRRAGFALMATLAVHDKQARDRDFDAFLTAIAKAAGDERNFVKKAVNWALRQVGKRNSTLRRKAVRTARAIRTQDSRSARWIAADALRELEKKTKDQA
jgi:3-methyladenine DNA glycosylase AlkD